ncbi:MAG: cob(I)yrinic acid a,c-diamide adenosyltransferase [Lachnospiraceae bacterium]|nr:cob(I)yrinic acid a,c-diamide adenosyltransferase [Lachnospiraceae bacterium]
MSEIHVICGAGAGKTSDAVGAAVRAASAGKEVIFVQFLKGSDTENYGALTQIDPQIKLLSFEKTGKRYEDLTEVEQEEQKSNIMNGFHYARKVIQTNECDLLILDESLGLVDSGVIEAQEIIELLELSQNHDMEILLTGRNLPDELYSMVDTITTIEKLK